MLLAQYRFDRRQCLSMYLLSLLMFALTAQHQCQIVDAIQCIRMLLSQHLFCLLETRRLYLIGLGPSPYRLLRIESH